MNGTDCSNSMVPITPLRLVPIQRYRQIKGEIVNPDCKTWLDDIMGSKSVVHDMNYINSVKKTLEDIKREEKDYISLEED